MINIIKETCDFVKTFIEEKTKSLNIGERNYTENVHELLDIKKNYNEVLSKHEETDRKLDLLYEYSSKLQTKKELKGYYEKIKE